MRSTNNSNTTSGSKLHRRSLSQGDTNYNSSVQMSPRMGHVTKQTNDVVKECEFNSTKCDDNLDGRNEIEMISEHTTSGTTESEASEVDEFRITHL